MARTVEQSASKVKAGFNVCVRKALPGPLLPKNSEHKAIEQSRTSTQKRVEIMAEEYNLDPIEPHLERLLDQRKYPKTLCPSEVARALSAHELVLTGAENWRDLMPEIRRAMFRLRDQNSIEVLQRGEVLSAQQSLDDVRGPIRIRRRPT